MKKMLKEKETHKLYLFNLEIYERNDKRILIPIYTRKYILNYVLYFFLFHLICLLIHITLAYN